jgi:A1 cistron-splicing factor AAR2
LTLLGHLQLAFIILLHLSSPSCLTVYKRLLSLLCRSTNIHVHPLEHLKAPRHAPLRALCISFIAALTAQLHALPDGVFDTELPELDVWFNEELEALRGNISRAMGEAEGLWADGEARKELRVGWEEMKSVARRQFGWEVGELQSLAQLFDGVGEEDEDEDGEYAPVVVDVPDDL